LIPGTLLPTRIKKLIKFAGGKLVDVDIEPHRTTRCHFATPRQKQRTGEPRADSFKGSRKILNVDFVGRKRHGSAYDVQGYGNATHASVKVVELGAASHGERSKARPCAGEIKRESHRAIGSRGGGANAEGVRNLQKPRQAGVSVDADVVAESRDHGSASGGGGCSERNIEWTNVHLNFGRMLSCCFHFLQRARISRGDRERNGAEHKIVLECTRLQSEFVCLPGTRPLGRSVGVCSPNRERRIEGASRGEVIGQALLGVASEGDQRLHG